MTAKYKQAVQQGVRAALTRHRLLSTAPKLATTIVLLAGTAPVYAQDRSEGEEKHDQPERLEEIVVTAQRRSQRIVDVPYNISAVTGDDLTVAGATNANDLTKVVAGLGNFADGPADRFGENNFSLRGLRTDPAGPNQSIKYSVSSVSTYYGDVPVFFSVLLKDIERVEVLRGPQGTLYGSGAQSGAIRFIPNRPSFDKTTGEFNASSGFTDHANNPNGSADGVINLPLAENLALRVSAAYVHQAGFLDQVDLFKYAANGVPIPSVPGDLTSGPVIAPIRKDTNSWTQWMARSALRYKPRDWLDLEVAYLHQSTDSKDAQVSNPAYQGGVRDLSDGFWPNAPYQTRPGGTYANTQSRLQPVADKVDMVSGTATFDLGFADLSSISAYYAKSVNSQTDLGQTYYQPLFSFVSTYNHYPRFAGDSVFAGGEKGITQEVRLVSKGNEPFSYVLGLYYEKQHRNADYTFVAPGINAFSEAACNLGIPGCVPPANPQNNDVIFGANQDFWNTEKAAFGELTYRITTPWQVTGGFRAFKDTQVFDTFEKFPFFGAAFGDGVTEPIAEGASFHGYSANSSKVVFKANTSYDLDRDNKVYFTYAQGYRRGGANPFANTGPTASLPQYDSFKPDIANNYEVGIKGLKLDRRLSYSVSYFWIDQKDFQFSSVTPAGFTGIFNGKKATSKGIELEGSVKATPDLTLSATYALTQTNVPDDTVLRDYANMTLVVDPVPVIVDGPTVRKGSVLPGVSKHAATAAIDYAVHLAGDSRLILHTNANYRSAQNSFIDPNSPLFGVIPSVFTADARITYDSGKSWSASLFVTNLTNAFASTGTLGVQTTDITKVTETQSQIYAGRIAGTPRTIGLSLHYGF